MRSGKDWLRDLVFFNALQDDQCNMYWLEVCLTNSKITHLLLKAFAKKYDLFLFFSIFNQYSFLNQRANYFPDMVLW